MNRRFEDRPRRALAAWAGALVVFPLVLGGAGCTWVPLTPEGEQVRVLSSEMLAMGSCRDLGSTRSRTTTTVGPFSRNPAKIREEQTSLARNEAARMGGDAISAEGPPEDGERVFRVYRCAGESPES